MCLKLKLYMTTHLYNSYKIKLPSRSFSLTGDTKSSNGSNSLPGVAVGSFFGGAVVTLLICLLVVFVKRTKKRKSHVSDLPLTVREQPTDEPQVENQENFSNWRPPKDKGPFLLRKAFSEANVLPLQMLPTKRTLPERF